MDSKRYRHRCKDCVFLKRYEKYDLYFCPRPVVVARYGDGERDELTPRFQENERPAIREALRAAEEQNIKTGYGEQYRRMDQLVVAQSEP